MGPCGAVEPNTNLAQTCRTLIKGSWSWAIAKEEVARATAAERRKVTEVVLPWLGPGSGAVEPNLISPQGIDHLAPDPRASGRGQSSTIATSKSYVGIIVHLVAKGLRESFNLKDRCLCLELSASKVAVDSSSLLASLCWSTVK